MSEEGIVVVHCVDGPGAPAARPKLVDSHSRRLREAPFALLSYGPLRNADGGVTGSLFLVRAGDTERVADFFAGDPFSVEGVWQHVQVHSFQPSPNGRIPLTGGAR